MAQTKPAPLAPPPSVALEFLSPADEIAMRPYPPASRLTLHSLLLAMLFGGLWASQAEIDRVVTASGRLVTTTATIIAQPMETSIIRSIEVRPGDVVHRGQVLATFDPTFTEADVGQLEAKRLSLAAQISRLDSELNSQKEYHPPAIGQNDISGLEVLAAVRLQERLFVERRDYLAARRRQYEESLTGLETKLTTNRREQDVLRERLHNLKEIQAMRQELLNQRSGSRLSLLEARDQMLDVERQLAIAVNTEGELLQQRVMSTAEHSSFTTDWRQKAAEDLVAARRERDGVTEQLNKASRRNDLVTVTAQADAVVLEIAKRSVGSIAQAAEPLITMVPAEAPLEAEVQVEPRDIGLLRSGDTARIKLEAFPFQRHGTLSAQLRTISEDTLARKEQPASKELEADQRSGATYYSARLDITNANLRAVPPDTRLLPGLTLTAEIIVGHRTVLSYFIYPLIKGFDESLREP